MKKIKFGLPLLFCLAVFLSANLVETKAQHFNVGDKDLNMMIGFGRTGNYGISNGGLIPISVSLDYGWRDDIGPGVISLGGYFGANTLKIDWILSDYKITFLQFAARSTYHYQLIDELDTYAGLMLGLEYASYSYNSTIVSDNTDIDLYAAVVLGAKYYFNDNLAVMAELGYSIAWFNIGICYKIQ